MSKDPLYSGAVRQFLKPFGRIVERCLLRRYRNEGAWRAGTVQFTCLSLADAYSAVLGDFTEILTFAATNTPLPEQIRSKVREHAADLAALCLILIDQAGCDLLDQAAVDRAVNEVRLYGENEDRSLWTLGQEGEGK